MESLASNGSSDTVDRAVKINFHVKYFVARRFHNVVHIHILIFHAFPFCRFSALMKIFYWRKFPDLR